MKPEKIAMEEKTKRERISRLLIVEDEQAQLYTLTSIMQDEGFDVIGCSSASEMFDYLRRLDVGVVLLDLRLPDLSGRELLKRLDAYTDNVQFIINTGYGEYQSAKEALNLGAFAYVEKASDPDELIRHVHRAFRARLRSYADELEAAVELRTLNLHEANESLQKEIDERKQAEKELENIFNLSPDMICVCTPEGKILKVNPSCEKILGYTADEILELGWTKLVHPDDIKRTEDEVVRQMNGDAVMNFVNRFRCKDGTYKTLEWQATHVINGIMYAVARDITERKKAEQTIRLHSEIMTNMSEAVYLIRAEDGIIVYTNPEFERMFGYSHDEMPGKHVSLINAPTDKTPQENAKEITEELMKKKTWQGEVYNRRKDGTCFWCYSKVSVFNHPEHGDVFLSVHTDITQAKKAEEQRLEYQRRLKSLASELTLTEERERSRLAVELHDQVCQSLAAAKCRLDLLSRSATGSDTTGEFETISELLRDSIRSSRDLTFDLSSPLLHDLGLEAAISEWLDENIKLKYGIECDFQVGKESYDMDEDVASLLFRNVRELLTNVVKHAEASKVKVCISTLGNQIRICIEDDGMGFDPDESMSKFGQDKTKFGIFSIRERLEGLGGSFEIDSAPGRGCRAVMTTPIIEKSERRDKNEYKNTVSR